MSYARVGLVLAALLALGALLAWAVASNASEPDSPQDLARKREVDAIPRHYYAPTQYGGWDDAPAATPTWVFLPINGSHETLVEHHDHHYYYTEHAPTASSVTAGTSRPAPSVTASRPAISASPRIDTSVKMRALPSSYRGSAIRTSSGVSRSFSGRR